MKTQIDKKGVLRISPETELEEYALRKWCEDNNKLEGSILIYSEIRKDLTPCRRD